MVLPQNGRIVIVDDNINEAAPLMKILSKLRVPFNYYSGVKASEFPDNPNENKLRILFLDLNIFELTTDEKSVISSIHPILQAIIPDNPNPYLLVIWSKKPDVYRTALENHFAKVLSNKIPAKIIFLHKGNYFDYKEGNWHPQENCIERIENDLMHELNNISVLKNLICWENVVHRKAAETLSEFSSFYPVDADWDKNMKSVIYRLAKAVLGTDDILIANPEEKLAKAFINVNAFLADKLESEIENLCLGTIDDLPVKDDDAKITSEIQSKINSTLHVSQKNLNITSFGQGNIYLIPDADNLINKIIWEKLFSPPNDAKLNEIRGSNPILIQLDITPVCDYSQDKKYVRLIYGLIVDPKHTKYFRGNYYYVSPLMKVDNDEKCIVFDFRHITTVSKEFIINRGIIAKLTLRREICTDIQSQFSNQINRPGISNL
jgi:hypothetical protein